MLAVTSLMFCCSGFGGSCSMSISTVPLPLNFWTSVGSSSLLLQPVGTMVENLPVVSGVPVSGDGEAVCGTDEPLDVGVRPATGGEESAAGHHDEVGTTG